MKKTTEIFIMDHTAITYAALLSGVVPNVLYGLHIGQISPEHLNLLQAAAPGALIAIAASALLRYEYKLESTDLSHIEPGDNTK